MDVTTDIVLEGLTFPECPRWHHGRLWFSDVHAHRIIALAPDGTAETVAETGVQNAGLGWRPDGTLLVVSMVERRLTKLADGKLETVAELSEFEDVQLNDMCVHGDGRAYIGGFGFDINLGHELKPASLLVVEPDGHAGVAADNLMFPNGIVITHDGATLIVAETAGRRVTAFDVGEGGALSNRREWAALDVFPDGICLDADGAVWVASPVTGECVRVREGGEVAQRIKARANGVYACMLGGEDRRTLYLCTANTTGADIARGVSTGWIESVRVDVPGAGLP